MAADAGGRSQAPHGREHSDRYLDENVSSRVADLLRARGLDVVSAYEVGNTQLDDRAQLEYSAQEGRAIVTCNVVDFVGLAADAVPWNTEHSGIILGTIMLPDRRV